MNQLTSIDNDGEKQFFNYDNNGNLISEHYLDNEVSYTYDGFDRITSNDKYAKYRYDGLGNRVIKDVNGATSQIRYIGKNILIISQVNGLDSVDIFYRLGAVVLKENNDIGKYELDFHNSVIAIRDSENNADIAYSYDTFGGIDDKKHYFNNPLYYSSYSINEITDDYPLYSRPYRPEIGRFIQEDSYQGDGHNRYLYVSNNPLTFTDSFGYDRSSLRYGDEVGLEHDINKLIDTNLLDSRFSTASVLNSSSTQITQLAISQNPTFFGGVFDYIGRTCNYLMYGEVYTDDVTFAGIIIHGVLGFAGLDAPLDVRDLFGYIDKWEFTKEHMINTGITAISLLPLVGVFKHGMKALDHGNDFRKAGDAAERALKIWKCSKNGCWC